MASQPDNLTKLQTQLAAIDAAIVDIAEGGAKIVVGDREYTAADLADLTKLRNDIWGSIQSIQGTMFRRVTFGRVS